MRNQQYLAARQGLQKIIGQLKQRRSVILPTETELMKNLKVGRNTIRKAMDELVLDGLLKRVPGKGTFIAKGQRELIFTNWSGAEFSLDNLLDSLVCKFEQDQTDFKVNNVSTPYNTYLNHILSLFLRGRSPDILQITPFWLAHLRRYNLFLSLSPYLSQDIVQRRYPKDIELGRFDEEIFSLNWNLCPLVLYYNKVVLERAGLDPEAPPRSLDELAESCARINEQGIDNTYGFCFPLEPITYSFLQLYPFLLSFKGGFSDPIGNIIIDCEENVTALRWFTHFYRRGGTKRENNLNNSRLLFAADQLAFMIDGPYGRGHCRGLSGLGKEFDSHYGIAPIPVGPSGRSESLLLAHSLAVSRFTDNPEAAYQWIKYLASDEENAKGYFEAFGMIPCMRDLLHKPYFLHDPFASVLIKQAESASLGPVKHPLLLRSVPFIMQEIQRIVLDGEDPVQGLSFLKKIIHMIGQDKNAINFIK